MAERSHHRASQRGATALEFALIFPLLFALLYGVVVYSYVFVLQESMTYAAQQAASAAVSVSPTSATYENDVRTRVRAAASATLSWLPQAQQQRVLGNNGDSVQVNFPASPAGTLVAVRMLFDLEGMFPAMDLPFVGEFPPLPQTLISSTSVVVGEP